MCKITWQILSQDARGGGVVENNIFNGPLSLKKPKQNTTTPLKKERTSLIPVYKKLLGPFGRKPFSPATGDPASGSLQTFPKSVRDFTWRGGLCLCSLNTWRDCVKGAIVWRDVGQHKTSVCTAGLQLRLQTAAR